MLTSIRPEFELLLCCARKHTDSQRIKLLLQQKLDWEYFIKSASRHKVISLVYNNLAHESIPHSVLDQLQKLFYSNAQRSLLLTGELIKILQLLQAENITAVPYKGPVLASLLYGNVALRPAGDLDIVVQQADVLQFKQILINEGYEPLLKMTVAEERNFLQGKGEHSYNFFHYGKKILIEIHWRITPEYTSPIQTMHFWNKLEYCTLAGTKILTLPLENWLPILCVHGSRHRWERLNWLCDIAEIIQLQPDMNWQDTIQLTTELDCRRMLFIGIFLAHYLLGAKLPQKVLQQIEADKQVVSLASKIIREMAAEHQQKFMARTIYHLKVRERWQNKVLYFESFLRWLVKSKK
jgi:hypothetical protein